MIAQASNEGPYERGRVPVKRQVLPDHSEEFWIDSHRKALLLIRSSMLWVHPPCSNSP